MTVASQGSEERQDAFQHSEAFTRMRVMRAAIARGKRYRFHADGNAWHLTCTRDSQSIAKVTNGEAGFSYTITELLSLAVDHEMRCHADSLPLVVESDYV